MSCDVRNIAIIFFVASFLVSSFCGYFSFTLSLTHQTDTLDRMNMDSIYALYSREFFLFVFCLFLAASSLPSSVLMRLFVRVCVCALAIHNHHNSNNKWEKKQPKRSAQSEWLEMCKIRRVCISLLFSSSFCKKKKTTENSISFFYLAVFLSGCWMFIVCTISVCLFCSLLSSVRSVHTHDVYSSRAVLSPCLKTHKLCELFVFVLFRILVCAVSLSIWWSVTVVHFSLVNVCVCENWIECVVASRFHQREFCVS